MIADAAGKSCFRLDASVFDEAGLEFAFDNCVRFRHRFVYIAAGYAAANQHVLCAMMMDERGIRRERFIDASQCGQLFPGDAETCRVKTLNRTRITHDCGDRFTAIPGPDFRVSEDRLVGEAWNHSVAIFAGNIFVRKHGLHAGISGDVGLRISEAKIRPVVGTADYAQGESACRNFICSVDFRAFNFGPSIEADQALANRSAGCRRRRFCAGLPEIENGVDNFAVASAAAEDAAQRIHHIGFGWAIVFLEQRRGRDQHARRARTALRRTVTEKRFLQTRK